MTDRNISESQHFRFFSVYPTSRKDIYRSRIIFPSLSSTHSNTQVLFISACIFFVPSLLVHGLSWLFMTHWYSLSVCLSASLWAALRFLTRGWSERGAFFSGDSSSVSFDCPELRRQPAKSLALVWWRGLLFSTKTSQSCPKRSVRRWWACVQRGFLRFISEMDSWKERMGSRAPQKYQQ